MGCRHYRRRARRAELKADAVILLDRVMSFAHSPDAPSLPDGMLVEIAEMRLRLAPPPGVKAPIVRTGYTRGRR